MIPVHIEEFDITDLNPLQKELTVKEFADHLNIDLSIAIDIESKLEFRFRKRKKPVVKLPEGIEIIDEVTLN